jgi:hypothetical protein
MNRRKEEDSWKTGQQDLCVSSFAISRTQLTWNLSKQPVNVFVAVIKGPSLGFHGITWLLLFGQKAMGVLTFQPFYHHFPQFSLAGKFSSCDISAAVKGI